MEKNRLHIYILCDFNHHALKIVEINDAVKEDGNGIDGNLSVLMVEIGEKTCDRFKGYVSRNLKLAIVNVIVSVTIVITIIMAMVIILS